MKKQHLALAGLAAGLVLASCENSSTASKNQTSMNTTKMLSEQDLVAQLTPEGRRSYQALDSDGKKMALKLANQSCAGRNECAGQNSCATDTNSCKGNGTCKGTSKGPFADKNDAVKVAEMNMAKKRDGMLK